MTGKRGDAIAPTLDISNIVAAFSEEQVERIVGLRKGRLRYWARTNFFKPSFVEDDARLPYSRFYSFKNIVALRTLELLRVQNKVPLQHLRRVAEKLSHLKDDLWVNTTLYVLNGAVVIENPETGGLREVASDQYLLGIPLSKVIADTKADVLAFRQRPDDAHGKITRSRAIAHNAWVVSGTRIPVASIFRLSEDGFSEAQIIGEYPDLTIADIKAAINHYKQAAA